MNYNKTKQMREQQTFDLGQTLVTFDVERASTKDALLFTAYVNGVSLRSANLHLEAVRHRILRGVWLMAGAEENVAVSLSIENWILSRLAQPGRDD
jgi:hypothetical protein